MKKNYTLKLVLAALVVVLVSLVSFVGVYKGRNLVKGYFLGKDFGQRKVATFSVVEEEPVVSSTDSGTETTTENSSEQNETEEGTQNNQNAESTENAENKDNSAEQNNENVAPLTEEQKKENYNKTKNNIAKRLTAMQSEEFDIRLDENTGKLVVEVSADMDSNYLSQIVTKGKVQIKNTNTNEVVVDGNVFKDASARLDTRLDSSSVVVLNMKFTNDARNKLNAANKNYTDSEGKEAEATFAVVLDEQTLYSEKASTFVNYANSGKLDLMMGQGDQGEELDEDYQTALAVIAIVKCGEIPVEYEIDSLEIISSNISIKSIVITASVIGALMFVYALYKFRAKAVLPVLSLIGLVATILLVLRYTNVKITLFTILGLALIIITNYIAILKTLNNNKQYKENFIKAINVLIPCIIVAIVFCCAPYLQLASFGMAIFWGLIVMCIYNAIIVRTFIEK